MRFEDLNEFQQELLAEAYQAQHVQRLRALIGVPVAMAISSLAGWYFIVSDESGHGGMLGWPIILTLCVVSLWMLAETVSGRNVRWAIRSFNLEPDSERMLLESMRNASVIAQARRRARSEIHAELEEGARRVKKKQWWRPD
jgi:hypothetical protein